MDVSRTSISALRMELMRGGRGLHLHQMNLNLTPTKPTLDIQTLVCPPISPAISDIVPIGTAEGEQARLSRASNGSAVPHVRSSGQIASSKVSARAHLPEEEAPDVTDRTPASCS